MTDAFGNTNEDSVKQAQDWAAIQAVKGIMDETIDLLNAALDRGIAVEFSIQQRPIDPTGDTTTKKEYFLAGFKADMTDSIVKPVVKSASKG